MANARKGDAAMNEFEAKLRSAVTYTIMILLLALFGAAMKPGGYQPKPTKPLRDPMVLVASPNDPQMIAAIKSAQLWARSKAGGNAWSKPKGSGPTATFATPGGSITLTRAEIAEANSVYPHFAARARHPRDMGTMRRLTDAGFDPDFSDHSQWGN